VKRVLDSGAAILLAVAVLVFLSTFAYQLGVYGDVLNGLQAGTYQGSKPNWLTLVTAFASALGSAALPFVGACLVDRFDRFLSQRERSK
jgi:hypothetical protein